MSKKTKEEIELKLLVKRAPKSLEIPGGRFESVSDIEQTYITVDGVNKRLRKEEFRYVSRIDYVLCQKKKIRAKAYEETEENLSETLYDELMDFAKKRLYKTRFRVPYGKDNLMWEIDVYDDFALVIVEIEVPYDDYPVEFPNWLKDVFIMEVTDFDEFKNYNLAEPV